MPYKNKDRQKEHQRTWVAKRRAEFLLNKECSWCHSKENLVLHHTDPSQKEDHRIWSWAKERREAEIVKCIVICDDCHTKHHADLSRRFEHGLSSTYKKGCRCQPCKEAQYRTQKTKAKWYHPVNTPATNVNRNRKAENMTTTIKQSGTHTSVKITNPIAKILANIHRPSPQKGTHNPPHIQVNLPPSISKHVGK